MSKKIRKKRKRKINKIKDPKILMRKKLKKLLKKVNFILVLNLRHNKNKDMLGLKTIHLKSSVQIYHLKLPAKNFSNILTHLFRLQIHKWPSLLQLKMLSSIKLKLLPFLLCRQEELKISLINILKSTILKEQQLSKWLNLKTFLPKDT